MWTNEIIFSEGDLCNLTFYLQELDNHDIPFFDDRLSHVTNMIARLQAEKDLLISLIREHEAQCEPGTDLQFGNYAVEVANGDGYYDEDGMYRAY